MRYKKLYAVFIWRGHPDDGPNGKYFSNDATTGTTFSDFRGCLYHDSSCNRVISCFKLPSPSQIFVIRISAKKLPIPIVINKIDLKAGMFYWREVREEGHARS